MSKLFKFVREEQSHIGIGDNVPDKLSGVGQAGAQATVEGKSDRLVPDGGTVIDVVKNFKWTKTKRNSVGRDNTPAIELQEFYVTLPAFYSNLNVAKQIATSAGKGISGIMDQITKIAGSGQSVVSAVKEGASSVNESVERILEQARATFGVEEMKMPQYLKAYEMLYGVKRSNFIYKLPYLDDTYKEIQNQWQMGGGTVNETLTTGIGELTDLIGAMAMPGVGIDFSKSFSYPTDGPKHTFEFFLDNTRDSAYTGEEITMDAGSGAPWVAATGNRRVVPNYETNYRLIFLLLYQNMPNKLNRVALTPPVIYRAKLPGVFSYRYSFLSSIKIEMLGTRKNKVIPKFITTEGNRDVQAVIPEGYKINLTLQSLVPETQNLYFDAINNPVFSTEE
jgi:hypothetical protein